MYEIAIISFGYVICWFNLLMSLFINVSEDEKLKLYGQFKQRFVKVQKNILVFLTWGPYPTLVRMFGKNLKIHNCKQTQKN